MRRRNLRGGNRRIAPSGSKPRIPPPVPDGMRNVRAPLGLNRVQPPFWPPSEIPRSVVDPFRTVLALSASRPIFTADYYAVDGVTGKVASFIDWNDATHLLAQATSARQVPAPTVDSALNGRLAAVFSGGQVYESNKTASFFNYLNATPHYTQLVLKPTNTSFAIWAEVGLGTPPDYWNLINNTGVQYNFARGGTGNTITRGGTVVANTPLAIAAWADSSVPTRSLRVSGDTTTTAGAVSGTAGAITAALSLGSRKNLAAGASNMNWRSLVLCGLLTSDQRQTMATWVKQDSGLVLP